VAFRRLPRRSSRKRTKTGSIPNPKSPCSFVGTLRAALPFPVHSAISPPTCPPKPGHAAAFSVTVQIENLKSQIENEDHSALRTPHWERPPPASINPSEPSAFRYIGFAGCHWRLARQCVVRRPAWFSGGLARRTPSTFNRRRHADDNIPACLFCCPLPRRSRRRRRAACLSRGVTPSAVEGTRRADRAACHGIVPARSPRWGRDDAGLPFAVQSPIRNLPVPSLEPFGPVSEFSHPPPILLFPPPRRSAAETRRSPPRRAEEGQNRQSKMPSLSPSVPCLSPGSAFLCVPSTRSARSGQASAISALKAVQFPCQRRGKIVINIKVCTWHGWKECEIRPKNR